MDSKNDDLSERRAVHVKCEAARTIGTQPPEPCSPKWRRRGGLQFQAALRRLDCRNYHHAVLSFLDHKTRKSGRVKILSTECDLCSAVTTRLGGSHHQRSRVLGVHHEDGCLAARVPAGLSSKVGWPSAKPKPIVG